MQLIKGRFLLKKFPGKGGWTYAELPNIRNNRTAPFGWRRVRGAIDSWQIEKYHLMPMGNGQLFLPVKAAIRKKIGKEAGDYISIELYEDDTPLKIPQEFVDCLETEPGLYHRFLSLKEGEQKEFIDWIFSAKTEQTKADRIVRCIDLLEKNKTFRSKKET